MSDPEPYETPGGPEIFDRTLESESELDLTRGAEPVAPEQAEESEQDATQQALVKLLLSAVDTDLSQPGSFMHIQDEMRKIRKIYHSVIHDRTLEDKLHHVFADYERIRAPWHDLSEDQKRNYPPRAKKKFFSKVTKWFNTNAREVLAEAAEELKRVAGGIGDQPLTGQQATEFNTVVDARTPEAQSQPRQRSPSPPPPAMPRSEAEKKAARNLARLKRARAPSGATTESDEEPIQKRARSEEWDPPVDRQHHKRSVTSKYGGALKTYPKGDPPSGSFLHMGTSIEKIRKEMQRTGTWDNRYMKNPRRGTRGMGAAPGREATRLAFWRDGTDAEDPMDGYLISHYRELREKDSTLEPLNNLLWYSDPSKYPAMPKDTPMDRVHQKAAEHSLLKKMFNQRSGLAGKAGTEANYQVLKSKLDQGHTASHLQRGYAAKHWLAKYADSFGGPEFRGMGASVLEATNSHMDLRTENRRIMRTLGPLYSDLAGGGAPWLGVHIAETNKRIKPEVFGRDEDAFRAEQPRQDTIINLIDDDDPWDGDEGVRSSVDGVQMHSTAPTRSVHPSFSFSPEISPSPDGSESESAQILGGTFRLPKTRSTTPVVRKPPRPSRSRTRSTGSDSDVSSVHSSLRGSGGFGGDFGPYPLPVRGARRNVFGYERNPRVVKRERQVLREMDARPPSRQQQQTSLAVETPYQGAETTSYTHMIEGDIRPAVGRVHLVRLGDQVGDARDSHLLTEMDADANMGAKKLREQSRRGPFKSSTGRSRVMDRSAHVAYRRRLRALEITISRGVTLHEMDTLIGKLGAHRLATHGSFLFIIKGTSRKKVGALDRIDLRKLRDKIHECLDKHRACGLLVQDTQERGTMHKAYSHGMEMKENFRQARSHFGSS